MAQLIEHTRLTVTPPGTGADVEGPVEVSRCELFGAVWGSRERHVLWRDLVVGDCEVTGGGLHYVTVEDTVIDTLTAKRVVIAGACRFKHVVLRGKIGKFVVNGMGTLEDDDNEVRREAERDYYADVDWALDLTEVDAAELSFKGSVPGRLVRLDPDTAGVMTLDAARSGSWRDVDFTGSFFASQIASIARTGWPDDILLAPRTGKNAAAGQRVIAELRAQDLLLPP